MNRRLFQPCRWRKEHPATTTYEEGNASGRSTFGAIRKDPGSSPRQLRDMDVSAASVLYW
jgi:hypothetical protein